MPKEKCMYSTKLFADKVMPKLRNTFSQRFPESATDNRFWCKPLSKRARPGSLPASVELGELAGREA